MNKIAIVALFGLASCTAYAHPDTVKSTESSVPTLARMAAPIVGLMGGVELAVGIPAAAIGWVANAVLPDSVLKDATLVAVVAATAAAIVGGKALCAADAVQQIINYKHEIESHAR